MVDGLARGLRGKKGFACFVLGVTILQSCSSNQPAPDANRNPQSVADVIDQIPQFVLQAQDEQVFNQENCTVLPERFVKYFVDQREDYFIPKGRADQILLKDNLGQSINELFKFQMLLRSRYKKFTEVSVACQHAMTKALRTARVAIDYLIDWGFERGLIPAGKPVAMAGGAPYTLANADVEDVSIKTGDVFLQRGNTFISATIARFADEDSNFSHLAIVGEDPQTGKKYVIESEPESGVLPVPLDEWLAKPSPVRALQLRYRDETFARKTGVMMYKWIRNLLDQKSTYRYDFAMQSHEYSQLYCSEVLEAAFDWGSKGKVKVPEFPSSLTKYEGHKFLDQSGITARTVFAPGDIEIDRRFTVVREWRRVARVSDKKSDYVGMTHLTQVRIQDASITSMFDWMFKYNYELSFDLGAWAEARLAKAVLDLGFAKSMAQDHIPAKFVNTTIRVMAVTGDLEKNMISYDKKVRAETQMGATFKDLMGVSEHYRRQDCEVYKKHLSYFPFASHDGSSRPNPYPASDFHFGFHSVAKDICPL